jgi:hypothetical protein
MEGGSPLRSGLGNRPAWTTLQCSVGRLGPSACEICVTRPKEPKPFVSPLADGWHALQGAVQ